MSTDPSDTTLIDLQGEGSAEGALSGAYSVEVRGVVQMHLDIARVLEREGSMHRAFQELVRASRSVPMNARLAGALVTLSLKAGTTAPARSLIAGGAGDTQGEEHREVVAAPGPP